MIWTLLPGAVFLADGCLKKKAEEELKENEQIPGLQRTYCPAEMS